VKQVLQIEGHKKLARFVYGLNKPFDMQGDVLSNTIRLIKEGNEKVLTDLYAGNRKAFINFAKNLGFGADEAVEAFQESVIILWENANNGKIDNLKSSITTYLFAIGKNKLLRYRKAQSHLDYNLEKVLNKKIIENDVNFLEQKATNKQRLIQKALKRLGVKCVELLELFYLEGLDLDEMMKVLEFKNKASLRSQKSRCLKQLKELIKLYEN
jgi:RNA polymerase sigma factor (sigma-70 family)